MLNFKVNSALLYNAGGRSKEEIKQVGGGEGAPSILAKQCLGTFSSVKIILSIAQQDLGDQWDPDWTAFVSNVLMHT